MKHLYLIRHCQAGGQDSDAPLTVEGQRQANQLADFLCTKEIDYIVSSPYLRARQSIAPLASRLDIEIEIDERLQEKVLSTISFPDWFDRLKQSYEDMDLSFEGGESSNQAMKRGVEALQDVMNRPEKSIAVVTHGALMSLLLKHYNPPFGFKEWQHLTNPDVFHMAVGKKTEIRRIWK